MVQRHGDHCIPIILNVLDATGSGSEGGALDVPGSWFLNIKTSTKWISTRMWFGASAVAMSADRHVQDLLSGCLASVDATLRQWGGWLGRSPEGYTDRLEEDLYRGICVADGTKGYWKRLYGGGDVPDEKEGEEEGVEGGGEE